MKKVVLIFFLFLSIYNEGLAQIKHTFKIETSFLKYRFNVIHVDPGPGWKGYNLTGDNGIEISFGKALRYKDKFQVGIDIGYLNFSGINGLSVISGFEFLPSIKKISPLLYFDIGYSHIWNQYEKGTGTALGEIGIGVSFRISEKKIIYVKSGYLGIVTK